MLREAKARRALPASPTAATTDREKSQEIFLERLGQLMRDKSERAFSESVGLSHTTVNKWLKHGGSPSPFHLRRLGERAELPGVPTGRISADWLIGLSDEPSLDARAQLGVLASAFTDHLIEYCRSRGASFNMIARTLGGSVTFKGGKQDGDRIVPGPTYIADTDPVAILDAVCARALGLVRENEQKARQIALMRFVEGAPDDSQVTARQLRAALTPQTSQKE